MKRFTLSAFLLTVVVTSGFAQQQSNRPPATPPPTAGGSQTPAQPPQPQQQDAPAVSASGLNEYGVTLQPDPRLIIMMAALEAANYNPTPEGRASSQLRREVREAQTKINPDLLRRLRTFYDLNKIKGDNVTAAEQAARYISLALAMGPPPTLEAPPRNDELPGDVLEVLDFAPLVQEFYRTSGIDERLPTYVDLSRKEGAALLPQTAELVRSVLSYLHTRPTTVAVDRVVSEAPAADNKKKKAKTQAYTLRGRDRRFMVVPDLLAVPNSINFRVIADDYYLIVPPSARAMTTAEVRRSYLRYVIDPLVLRFNRDISLRREALRQLIDARQKESGAVLSIDVFPAVTRSLVAAADARMSEIAAMQNLAVETALKLQKAKESDRLAIAEAAQGARRAVEDNTALQLAEAYEEGAVLSFYFADQLRGIETSGFDVVNVFGDMIASFDAARELQRPAQYKEGRERALAAQTAREKELAASRTRAATVAADPNRLKLIEQLGAIEELLNLKNYTEAETRLREMLREYPGEPRVFFALGQSYSLAARDAFDENLQAQRLDRALGFYRQASQITSRDTDVALLSRTHEAMGRILAFQDKPQDAVKEFEAAIALGPVAGGAHQEALAGKANLTAKP